MANTVINLRRGIGPFWSSTNLPAGVTGYTHGLVNVINFQTGNTFENSLTGKAEPWVNTTTKQLFVDGTCINPGLKLKINNGEASEVALKYDENYKVYYDLNISYSDQYLKKVANITIPSSENDADDITDWLTNLGLTADNTPSLSGSAWSVTIGGTSYSFNSGKNYIGFTWNTADDVTTPTFLEVPDTDTTYTANNGITISDGLVIGHSNIITGGEVVPTRDENTLKLPKITYDNHGHITACTLVDVELPSEGTTAASHTFDTVTGTNYSQTTETHAGESGDVTTDVIILQQNGLTSSNLGSYEGSLISFSSPTENTQTILNKTDNTVLVNVDIIDGGSFN